MVYIVLLDSSLEILYGYTAKITTWQKIFVLQKLFNFRSKEESKTIRKRKKTRMKPISI